MRSLLVAERYAQALLEAAGDQAGGLAEEMGRYKREELGVISRFLDHPRVVMEKKEALIDSMAEGGSLLARFLKRLIAKGRVRYLPEIFQVYPGLYRQKRGVLAGRVTLARRSDDATRARIQCRIEKLLSRQLELTWGEEPTLLGGFVFSTETLLLDVSIKRQLAALEERIKKASLTMAAA